MDRWAKHRGITREQVMAIGDNYNDIEMLAFAGLRLSWGMLGRVEVPRLAGHAVE